MPLVDAIFSPSQAKLYRWLFGHPERSFHLSELRRLSGLGSASLQRELRRLVDAGLASSDRVGTLRRFQANPESPVFDELVGLTRKVLGVAPVLRNALASWSTRVDAAFLFGSVAKGTDTAGSDIDLMVVANEMPLSQLFEVLLPLEEELGRKINPVCLTAEEFRRRRSEPDSFVNRVLGQPVIPLLGDLDALAGTR